jgi:chlorite dismutase
VTTSEQALIIIKMTTYLYHNYLFFNVSNDFYQLPKLQQNKEKDQFTKVLLKTKKLSITSYLTRGFKVDTTFMLWCQSNNPEDVPTFLKDLYSIPFGSFLRLTYSYFGIARDSQYSGRKGLSSVASAKDGKPEQVMQNYSERLPYLILYPFTKTTDWHVMDFESRKSIMSEHIKVGHKYPNIRQCLLYSYGIDDYEFLVSYETKSLQDFQDLIIDMRKTEGRKYTLIDNPIFCCIHKKINELHKSL